MISYAPLRFFRPHFLASFAAPSLASAPELQKKTLSTCEFSTMNCASGSCGRCVEEVRHLHDRAGLIAYRLGDLWVRVSHVEYCPAGGEV